MKKFLSFALAIYALLAITIIVLINYAFSFQKSYPASPLPEFLTYFKNNQVSSLNLWFPKFAERNRQFDISAKSAIVFDLTTQKILYSKNPQKSLPIASLSKIMTAVVALEKKKANNSYIVHKEDLVGENVMGLSQGEILSLDELLYGMFLNSGNDAAETLASNFEGGRSSFIKAMNKKAKSLGLKNTNFTNPTGLEGDGKQYSTAEDLLVIGKYTLEKFPLLTNITSTFQYNIYASVKHRAYFLENETNLITSYPGVRGIKDGYTPEAGLCLVTYLKYQDHEIIGILLGSENRRQEMKDLLDNALESLGIEPPAHT